LLPNLGGGQEAATWLWAGGSRIAYTEYEGELGVHPAKGRTVDLWLVDGPDSSQPVNLTRGQVYAPVYPRWSPDGSRIVFQGYPVLADGSVEGLGDHTEGGFTPPDTELFVVEPETLTLTRLTDDTWDDQWSVWAPDGNSLLLGSDRTGDQDLWLVPLDEPERAQLLTDDTDFPREDSMPDWYWGPH
jgi:Tol biopolymer transport system component